jgi:hypothetical protein
MDLGPMGRADEAALLLAQIAWRRDNPENARQICLKLLEHKEISRTIRQSASGLLGEIYARQKDYDKAALAYAGLPEGDGILDK